MYTGHLHNQHITTSSPSLSTHCSRLESWRQTGFWDLNPATEKILRMRGRVIPWLNLTSGLMVALSAAKIGTMTALGTFLTWTRVFPSYQLRPPPDLMKKYRTVAIFEGLGN